MCTAPRRSDDGDASRGVYLTVDRVVNVEDKGQDYRAEEHPPLGNEVKLFACWIQQDETVS